VSLGERLRKARERKGLSQVEVFRRTNINNNTLSRYEKDVNEPDLETLRKLADLYDVTLGYLFDMEESEFTETEKRILNEKDLSVSKLKDKYHLVIDGEDATDEDIEELIRVIKTWRTLKKEQD
jgi:transcriptional regulator with XRE-family HTH domain